MSDLAQERVVERLGLEPELSRDDLEAVLGGMSEGVAVRDPDGRIVYANAAAARLLGVDTPGDVLKRRMDEHRRQFEIFDINGRPLDPSELPGEKARAGEDSAELLIRSRPLGGGDEQVALVRAVRISDKRGELRYVVSFFRTVTEEKGAETLRRLEQVTKTALAHMSLADLVPSLLEAIRDVLHADTTAILLVDDAGTHLMMRVTVGFDEAVLSQAVPVPLGKGLAGRVAASRKSWLVDDLEEIDLVSPVLRTHGIRSLVAVPLIVEDRVIGVAHAGAKQTRHFGTEDVRLFELIADRVAIAVNHSALLAAERAAQQRLSFLGEASAVLASSLNYEDTLTRVAQLAVPTLADWCAVDMLAPDRSVNRLASTRFDGGDAVDATAVALVLESGEPQLDEDSLIVPITARGRTLGAISFCRSDGDQRYGQPDLQLALDLARRAGVAVDNAELFRETEERAQAARVLAAVGDGVVLVDRVGIVRYWNRAAESITGLARAMVIDRRAEDAIPGWETIVQRVPVALDPVSPPRAESLPLGVGVRELWLSVTGVSVVDGTVYAFRDLTEDRALDTMKTEFVSTVSHELRTPLAAIYGAAMTLRRDDVVLDDEQNATLLNVITNESDRLARTVNAILWASRLDTDALAITIERCDPRMLVGEIVDAQRTHLPMHVEIDVEIAAGVPAVSADADKVRQVLVNLVDNAVKYSPDGGTISVAVTHEERRVRFAVSDEGLGIPHSEQRRIFDKFYRLDPGMTRGIGGTGLGLYICRELVRRMDGRIWVTSEPGRGSTFAFELPVA